MTLRFNSPCALVSVSALAKARTRLSRHVLSSALVIALLGGCSLWPKSQGAAEKSSEVIAPPAAVIDSAAAPVEMTAFVDKRNFDPNTAACTDFFQHSNGGWLANTEIPADQPSWGSFNILAERSLNDLRAILDEASGNSNASGVEKQVADFYAAAMNESGIEASGVQALSRELARIAQLKSRSDVTAFVREQHAAGSGGLFGFYASPDFKDASIVIGYATQAGLGLPERDYYLRTDADSLKLLASYRVHIRNMMLLAGNTASEAESIAEDVLKFETRLAKASFTRVELRDPSKRYRIVSVAAADRETPNFSWSDYFKALGIAPKQFSLSAPQFFAEVNTMLADTPVSSWQNYFRFAELRNAAPYLSKGFVDENFEFFSKTLSGAKEQRPRWKRMVQTTSGSLGEPLGQLYVAKHFSPEAKAQASVMIDDLKSALKVRLEQLPWMSSETKKQALEKFATFTPKIGYPDKWRDYSSLSFNRTDLIGNLRAIGKFQQAYNLAKIGKATDRGEWGMSPQTVNAYYSPQFNQIVFPAAILQFPFFDPKADLAINYGGIGAVIGHELLHGFDDSGSKFDATGAQRNWWTKQDASLFEARTNKLVEHAAATQVGGLNINGKLTLGENIADLGGNQIALDALKIALARQPTGDIDGYTQTQRFYLSWAQIWRRAMRPESLKLQINTDTHSPSVYRVNGPLSNLDSFAQAFNCKPGDKMVNPTPVQIW